VEEEILKMIEMIEHNKEQEEDIGKIIITILVVEEMKDLVLEIKEEVVEHPDMDKMIEIQEGILREQINFLRQEDLVFKEIEDDFI